MERSEAIRAQSPGPSLDANGTTNNSTNLKPTQRVLGFLRKRSGPTTTTSVTPPDTTSTPTGRDRAKSMAIPLSSSSDYSKESRSPSPASNMGGAGGGGVANNTNNLIKNMIRRKSAELSRLFEGGPSTSSAGTPSSSPSSSARRSNSSNGSRASLDQEAFQEKRPSMALHDRIVSSVELTQSSAPSQPVAVTARPTGRRSTFSLGLPWRPQSEYSVTSATSSSPSSSAGLRSGLTKAQRRFVRAFPELADLVMVPSAYCAPCLATPPQTPPTSSMSPALSPSASMSPSNTLNTLSTSDFSSTLSSTSTWSACPGHFDDFACALEREILWQGTLYVTATHVCFYGKHFGKTVRVMVDYRDMVSMEKEKKMGVFPSSIRIRVRTTPTTAVSLDDNISTGLLDQDPSTKDYVLTSLMSREQAYAIIERNWTVHRQVMQNLCSTGLESPSEDIADMEKHATDIFDLDLEARVRSGSLRVKRRTPRTYSVITDEAFSSTENVDRPTLHAKLSCTLLRPSTPTGDSTTDTWNTVTRSNDLVQNVKSSLSSSSDSRRGSVASEASSEKLGSAGLIGFLHRKSSQLKRVGSNSTSKKAEGESSGSVEHQEIMTQTPLELAYSSPAVTGAPIPMQASLSSTSIRGDDIMRSGTPPPVLISPSLTTTKVSHSSSTVQTAAQPGSARGMAVMHTRNESEDVKQENCGESTSNKIVETPAQPAPVPVSARVPPPKPLPSGPISCGCQRHYKNAVVSTVIPLPLDLCFEILFSGKGAGQGDKLGCDTHRIKDASTDIKIMPWLQPDGSGSKSKNLTAWESQKRNLEYSVSFKLPMMAKTSTACFETQQVTQYGNYMILVHSESRTPSVPFGEHFSTVNQICMTWESVDKTRIKCFTEVKFKKSIMWSSKVESGSLEGSGGFYKEFIRQLQELAQSQGEQLIQAFAVSQQEEASSVLVAASALAHATVLGNTAPPRTPSPTNGLEKKLGHVDVANSNLNPSAEISAVASSLLKPTLSEPAEMSRAQSLLSQQFLRNAQSPAAGPLSSTAAPVPVTTTGTPTKGPVRLSLDSARLRSEEAASSTSVKDQLTPLLPSEKKSALSVFLESLAPSGFPIMTVAAAAFAYETKESNSSSSISAAATTAKDVGTAPGSGTTALTMPSSPTTPLPWGEFVRKGLTFFGSRSGQEPPLDSPGSHQPLNDSTVDTSSLSSLSSVSSSNGSSLGSEDSITVSRLRGSPGEHNDGVRVKFALPAGARRSFSRSADGGASSRLTSSTPSSSVRSFASVPSLRDQRLQHGHQQQHHHQYYEQKLEQQLQAQASQSTISTDKQQKYERLSRLLSRAIFGFVVLGMAVTALNVWHLFTVVSSVVEVVQQRHDLFLNGHQHHYLQKYYPPSSSYDDYSPYEPYQRFVPHHRHPRHRVPYPARYYDDLQQVPYYRQRPPWMSQEDYASWNQKPSSSSSSSTPSSASNAEAKVPSARPATPLASSTSSSADIDFEATEQEQTPQPPSDHEERQEPEVQHLELRIDHGEEDEDQVLAPLQARKELLKAEIVELFRLLEHARKELGQPASASF